jgi:hypothetical protein
VWTPCGLVHLKFLLFWLWPRRRRSTEVLRSTSPASFHSFKPYMLFHTSVPGMTGRSTEVLLRRTLAGCRPVKVKLLGRQTLASLAICDAFL